VYLVSVESSANHDGEEKGKKEKIKHRQAGAVSKFTPEAT